MVSLNIFFDCPFNLLLRGRLKTLSNYITEGVLRKRLQFINLGNGGDDLM